MEQFQKEEERWNKRVGWYAIILVILLSVCSRCKAEECVYDYKIQYTKAQVEQFKKYADTYSKLYRIKTSLLHATIDVESRWQGGISGKCARGISQILPSTVKEFCKGCYKEDFEIMEALDDPKRNIELAAVHFRWLKNILGDDTTLLIAAYGAGWGINKCPPERYSKELVDYILKVKKAMKDYEDSLPVVEPLNTVKLVRVK